MAETYTPTTGMATAAKRALAWKEEGRPGGTAVGLARANQLKDREPLSEDTVLRMHSFFSRHAVDKQATGFSTGEEGFPSPGRVAWDLWGGDGGQTWAETKRDQIMRAREGKSLSKKELNMSELEKSVLEAFATSYAFYAKTAGFHWNVVGQDFFQYHELFGEIYTEVYESIDTFAEQLRTLQISAPGSLQQILDLAQIEETLVVPAKDSMVSELLMCNETVLETLRKAYNLCGLYSKFGFENFLADRITAHEKHSWMLRSSQ